MFLGPMGNSRGPLSLMSPRRPGYLILFLSTMAGWLAFATRAPAQVGFEPVGPPRPGMRGGGAVATSAAAQVGFEPVGTRAQGMAGAFVAVADDATATYWNPAGLAS